MLAIRDRPTHPHREDRHRGFKRAGRPGRSAGYPAGRVRPPIGPMCFPIVRAIALPNVIVGSRPTVSCRCMFLCTGGVRAVWDCRSKTHLFVLGDNRSEHTTFPSGRPPVISGRPLPPGGKGGIFSWDCLYLHVLAFAPPGWEGVAVSSLSFIDDTP